MCRIYRSQNPNDLEDSKISVLTSIKKGEWVRPVLTTQAGARGINVRLFFPPSVWIFRVWGKIKGSYFSNRCTAPRTDTKYEKTGSLTNRIKRDRLGNNVYDHWNLSWMLLQIETENQKLYRTSPRTVYIDKQPHC